MGKKKGCRPGQVYINELGQCIAPKDLKSKTVNYYHKKNIPIKWDNLSLKNREMLIRNIVSKHGYARVISLGKKDLLDSFTAQHIKAIMENLKPANKKKFLNRSLYEVVDITWKLVDKAKK
jgi:hypothetical protein